MYWPALPRALTCAETALSLIVGSALYRLHLYEQAFGLTMLRLFSVLAAVWIGVVFVLLAVWLYLALMSKEFFVPAWLKARPLTGCAHDALAHRVEDVVIEKCAAANTL